MIEAALGVPLLEGVIVGNRGAVKRALEIGLRVGATEEMSAGRHFAEGFHRLTVFTQINALGHDVHGTELIDIHDEFLVGRGEPAFHPACGVKHEIRACQQSRHQSVGALVSRLSVGKLRSAKRPARAERHFHAASELGRAENSQRAFRCAKGRRARLHRER